MTKKNNSTSWLIIQVKLPPKPNNTINGIIEQCNAQRPENNIPAKSSFFVIPCRFFTLYAISLQI